MAFSADLIALSPRFFLKLDETSGLTAADSSGLNFGFSFGAAPTWGEPGSTDKESGTSASGWSTTVRASPTGTANVLAATASTGFTLLAAVKTTGTAKGQIMAARRGGDQYEFHQSATGKLALTLIGGSTVTITGNTSINDGNWHLVVGRWDGSNLTLYVDGVSDATPVAATSMNANSGPAPYVGVARTGVATYVDPWHGWLDYVVGYNKVLTTTEISNLYTAWAPTPATPVTQSSLPLSVAMPVASSAIRTTAASLPLSVALPVASTSFEQGTTTASLPITVGLGSATATKTALRITVGLPARATMVRITTASLPLRIGLPADAHQPGVEVLRTTAGLPLTVGMPATARIVNVLDVWDADLSQRALLDLLAEDATLHLVPPLAVAPPTLKVRPILRNSVVMDPPTLNANHQARVSWESYSVTEGVVGTPHVVISGKDVTYFRDAATSLGTVTRAQPFGDRTFEVTFPQIGPLDVPGTGDLTWLKPGASVEVFIATPSGTRLYRFAGHLLAQDTGNGATDASQRWQAAGALYQSDLVGHRVPALLNPTDIGTLIANDLNGVISRRYAPVRKVTTLIPSRQRGTLDDSAMDYCQGLLSTAWLEDGSTQWTVARGPGNKPRVYVIRPKDRTTVNWTLTTGAPGVATSLSRDLTGTVNCIYGRGVAPDGYAWAGWTYPNLLADDAPAYPFSSAGSVIMVGTTDGSTSSGDGVSTWQRRAVELGHRLTVDGVFSSADAEVCRDIQRRYGLLVDGIVGPQTWAATFDVGAAGGNLNAVRRPLAYSSEIEPRRFSANGADVGPNPAYNRSVLRIEREIDYGAGVTKAEATRSARADLARENKTAWQGQITLDSDPREGSRHLMDEGQNVRLLGFGGADLLLHIVEVSEDLMSGTVTLTVDEHARDAMALTAIQQRDRDSAPDPARRPGNVNRRSRQTMDIATEFDGESGAGIIPRHALYGGLWTVIRVPVSQVGRIALVDVRTQTPASKFCLALFGAPVTPAHLVKWVGNPLSGDDPFARTEAAALALDDLGFIEAFGGPGQAAGYWPRDEDGGVLTGKLIDTGGVEYVSARPPWVWIAEFSPSSTFISGRLRPAPVQ